MYRTAIFD